MAELIVDGVDVSECVYRDYRNMCCCDSSKPNEGEERITGRGGCKYNPNCHFKQLKRAEQKLEKIKEISKEYKVEYTVNNGVQLLTNKILQIIEGEENGK